MINSIRDCFVTGKWDATQDAATLLKQDGKKWDTTPVINRDLVEKKSLTFEWMVVDFIVGYQSCPLLFIF